MIRFCAWWSVLSLVAVLSMNRSLTAQTSQKPAPPLLIDSLVGRDLFLTYCAGCHGREGKGDGPVASAMKTVPSDLTTLARRNGGPYPASLVEATLNGTRQISITTAHGTLKMPIWGSIFRQLDTNESVAKVRVQNLIKYLESIQVREPKPESAP